MPLSGYQSAGRRKKGRGGRRNAARTARSVEDGARGVPPDDDNDDDEFVSLINQK